MANLKGTILSDENMLRHCEMQKIPNMSKLINVIGEGAQVPVNPKAYLRQLSLSTGAPLPMLMRGYSAGLDRVPNSGVAVVKLHDGSVASREYEMRARGSVKISKPIIQVSGMLPATNVHIGGTSIVNIPGAQGTQNTLLGGGLSPFATSFALLNRREQVNVLRNLIKDSRDQGYTTSVTRTATSQASKLQRESLLQTLLTDTQGIYDNDNPNMYVVASGP